MWRTSKYSKKSKQRFSDVSKGISSEFINNARKVGKSRFFAFLRRIEKNLRDMDTSTDQADMDIEAMRLAILDGKNELEKAFDIFKRRNLIAEQTIWS